MAWTSSSTNTAIFAPSFICLTETMTSAKPRPSLSSLASPRRKRKVSVSSVLLVVILFVLLLFVWLLFPTSTQPEQGGHSSRVDGYLKKHRLHNRPFHRSFVSNKDGAYHRIAIIIPFAGNGKESIPPYLDLFVTAAHGSASLVDFFIVHNGVLSDYEKGDSTNVKFINLESSSNMAQALMRVVDSRDESEQDNKIPRKKLQAILTRQIDQYPYVLVEYKPALGHIFSEYIPRDVYTHWGYSDLDIIMGDLPRWISKEELQGCDIVTYGYGDQERVYLRGQFTFHKNNDKINQLWRGCDYLVKMDERFEEIMSSKNKKHFSLESAEGCYSAVVLKRNDVSVKYAVKAFNDVSKEDTTNTHGVYLGFGTEHDQSVIYKHNTDINKVPFSLIPSTWFEQTNGSYQKRDTPLQLEVGDKEQVIVMHKNKSDAEKKPKKCMYWAQAKYQEDICTEADIKSTDTVFWVNGKLYKQPYQNMFPQQDHYPNMETAPFFHFQEWKRYYRSTQLTPCHRHGAANTCMLTKEGAIPMLPVEKEKEKSRTVSAFPLKYDLHRWRGVNEPQEQLPSRLYCLQSAPRKYPPVPPTSECQWSTSWQELELLSNAPDWNQINPSSDVTNTMTLQISHLESTSPEKLHLALDVLESNVHQWRKDKPSVVVIYMAGATEEAVESLQDRFRQHYEEFWAMSLVGIIYNDDVEMVSRKTLLNMARDVVPTRWMLTGLELERGLILSHEASLFCHASAAINSHGRGTVMIVPQFSVSSNDSSEDHEEEEMTSLSVSSLLEQQDESKVQGPDRLECGFCEDDNDAEDNVLETMYELWRVLTLDQLEGETPSPDDTARIALRLEQLQECLISLLTDPKMLDSINASPIMLVDNMGPLEGMRTVDVAREVEEFGGMKCYNGLWLAQLAAMGYTVQVLSGAFASSSARSRRVACGRLSADGADGTSRCDRCFMFAKDPKNILDAIAQDERVRPAKAAVLWHAITPHATESLK